MTKCFLFHLGGHTSELIRLLGSLSENYQPRIYIVANTDKMSLDKIEQFEKSRNGEVSHTQYEQYRCS